MAQISIHQGRAAGGRPAERRWHRLGIRVSDDTILRELLCVTQDNAPITTVIGNNLWKWRKSQNYRTIIVDLGRRKVVDTLEDDIAESCTE